VVDRPFAVDYRGKEQDLCPPRLDLEIHHLRPIAAVTDQTQKQVLGAKSMGQRAWGKGHGGMKEYVV
jgi:hypothetical protein